MTETQGKGQVKMEAETGGGLMPRTDRGHQKAGGGEGFSRAFRDSPAGQVLDFGPLASRTMRIYIFAVLSHPNSGSLLWEPQRTNTIHYPGALEDFSFLPVTAHLVPI